MKLRDWRDIRGFSQFQAGNLIGVSGVTVSRYEGGRVPEPEVLKRIIRITGGLVQPNDWFSETIEAEEDPNKVPQSA